MLTSHTPGNVFLVLVPPLFFGLAMQVQAQEPLGADRGRVDVFRLVRRDTNRGIDRTGVTTPRNLKGRAYMVVPAARSNGNRSSLPAGSSLAQRRPGQRPSPNRPTPAPAERPGVLAETFTALQETLNVGDQITITDQEGLNVRGRVVDLSATSLIVEDADGRGGGQRSFSEQAVVQIRRRDSSMNGMLIGAAAGGGAALLGVAGGSYEWLYIGSWLGPAVGALTGFFIDRATGNDLVFSRPSPERSVSVSPVFRRSVIGASVSLRF